MSPMIYGYTISSPLDSSCEVTLISMQTSLYTAGKTAENSNLFPLVFPSLFKLWSRKRWLKQTDNGNLTNRMGPKLLCPPNLKNPTSNYGALGLAVEKHKQNILKCLNQGSGRLVPIATDLYSRGSPRAPLIGARVQSSYNS